MGNLSARVVRLEDLALAAHVRRLAAPHGLTDRELDQALTEARRVLARLRRLRAQGLSGREALHVCAAAGGLDPAELEREVDAALEQLGAAPAFGPGVGGRRG